jgi:pimeloyl-ACP methyl ester carboxylesterase
MPAIDFNQGTIYYLIKKASEQQNYKKALIFIHGSGEHTFVWARQLKGIDSPIPLISLDLPSHGKSSHFEHLSLDLYVDSVKELKETLNFKKIIFCGHSLGGAVAQAYYFRYPEDVSALILMSTGAKLRVLPRILEDSKNNFNEFLKTIDVGAFYRKTIKRLINDYVAEVAKMDPMVVHQDFSICNDFNVLDKLETITIPCLIIVGKADKLTPVKYHKYFHKHLPTSELHIINKAGHSVMVEKPSKVNIIIEKFLRKVV